MGDFRLYSITETAEALNVSVSTVWRLIRNGRIRPVHPSPGTTRVTARELAAYIASLEGRRGPFHRPSRYEKVA